MSACLDKLALLISAAPSCRQRGGVRAANYVPEVAEYAMLKDIHESPGGCATLGVIFTYVHDPQPVPEPAK